MATRRSNDSQRTAKSSASVPPREVLSSEKPLGDATAPKRAPRRRATTSADRTEQPADALAATPVRVEVPEEARRAMIAEAAYLRAERRGFHPGYEVEDWLAAEAEVDALLSSNPGGAQ